ncbi:1-deoxy-D-xylulose-5-phosphate reductoisomerase [uncultured Desulfovibrio sp.]|uniref:1-deoxy-D-xylulose-5-phosphate reductoisomerase n=1 Tax=uncultured Desulfovibrio sp. TaxID=167968 RepID=UPI0026157002|nr:1-deoxy-D-xylulose-5-phosphate reductoisomerase [uncultured Desulfovibrio sp.]
MSNCWPGCEGPAIRYISAAPSLEWQHRERHDLVILGSTGSIGRNALGVVDCHPQRFRILALSCARNVDMLARQARRYRPRLLAVLDEESAYDLRSLLPADYQPEILVGPQGYAAAASLPEADTVLSAQVGAAGLEGTLAAALSGKVICLANKESLVLAGELLRQVCARTGASILPVDSEHNAIFQCLAARDQEVARLVLTASGGPFRDRSLEELRHVTREQALDHPNWVMGAKISIDSASMMNKALEVVEAFHLYGVPVDRIDVLVHPQSLVHSLVQLRDGSLLAQIGTADMRLPLAHCLLWPHTLDCGVPPLDLAASPALEFRHPDTERFPALTFARRALSERGGLCVVMNAANEAAVELFLAGRCAFTDITRFIDEAMRRHAATAPGHAPLCGKLTAPEGDDLALRAEVATFVERIEKLDTQSRALVHALARDGA